jgi:hypothetical protein
MVVAGSPPRLPRVRRIRVAVLAGAAALLAACSAGPQVVPGSPPPLTAAPTSSGAPPSPTPSRPAPAPATSGTAALPTAYVDYTLTGHGVTMTLPVPASWSLTRTANGVDFGDPSGRLLLRLEVRARTGDEDAVRAWETAEPQFTGLRAYRRLGLAEVPGVGDSAADLTFTFERGVTRQVVDRGIAVGGAWLAIYFSAEQRLYEAMLPVFTRATEGLRISGG